MFDSFDMTYINASFIRSFMGALEASPGWRHGGLQGEAARPLWPWTYSPPPPQKKKRLGKSTKSVGAREERALVGARKEWALVGAREERALEGAREEWALEGACEERAFERTCLQQGLERSCEEWALEDALEKRALVAWNEPQMAAWISLPMAGLTEP